MKIAIDMEDEYYMDVNSNPRDQEIIHSMWMVYAVLNTLGVVSRNDGEDFMCAFKDEYMKRVLK